MTKNTTIIIYVVNYRYADSYGGTGYARHMASFQGGALRCPAAGGEAPPTNKPVGRPKGVPSTIVNVRLPIALVAQLDRYLDRLEVQTGLKANRRMIARRALELFLAAHASDDTSGGKGYAVGLGAE